MNLGGVGGEGWDADSREVPSVGQIGPTAPPWGAAMGVVMVGLKTRLTTKFLRGHPRQPHRTAGSQLR